MCTGKKLTRNLVILNRKITLCFHHLVLCHLFFFILSGFSAETTSVDKLRREIETIENRLKEIEEGIKKQDDILKVLESLKSLGVVKNREKFIEKFKAAFREKEIPIPAALSKAILSALSERDETADICKDRNGKPEPDSGLRDYENVPMNFPINHKNYDGSIPIILLMTSDPIGLARAQITAYMKQEVLPHVPDAWVDESKTKIGYEINFNRYFYKYTPPRPLAEIEADLKVNEEDIAKMLAEMTG